MREARKIVSAVLAVLLLALAVSGCSGAGTQKEPAGEPTESSAAVQSPEPQGDIAMRFAWWGADPRHKATLAALDAYHQLHPNITIEGEYSSIDTYYQKLVTQFAGGTAPDIIQIDYPWLADFGSQGQFFENLSDYGELIDLSKFDQDYLKGWCYYGDQLQGLPFAFNGYSMMFNKNVVSTAGIDLTEDSQWTWDKLVEEGVKFKEKYPDYVFLHSDTQTLEKNVFKPYLIQTYGGQYINSDYTMPFGKDNLVKAYNFVLELQDKGLIQPLSETAAFEGKIDQNPAWANGKAAICIRWATDLIQLLNPNVEMGVARLPVLEGATDTAINCKPSMLAAIYSGSKYKEEAAKFINWILLDRDATDIVTDCRGVPAVSDTREYLAGKDKLNPAMKKAIDIASKNAGTPQNGLNDNAEITSISQDVMSKVLFKKLTPEQGADEYIQRVGEKLESMKNNK
jgi:oligogalacturonide transport system substrate-binding protein